MLGRGSGSSPVPAPPIRPAPVKPKGRSGNRPTAGRLRRQWRTGGWRQRVRGSRPGARGNGGRAFEFGDGSGICGDRGAPLGGGARAAPQAVRGRSRALHAFLRRFPRSPPRLLEEPDRRRDHAAPPRSRRGGGDREAPRGDVLGRGDQQDREAAGSPRGAPVEPGGHLSRRRRERRPGGPQGPRPHGRFLRGRALRRHRRGRRQVHRRGQYRHRRLRPRPAHGDPGAPCLPRRPAAPLRLERRRRRHPRYARTAQSGDDARPRRLEDLHHHRDDDQRGDRPALDRRRARRGEGRRPLRRDVDGPRQGLRLRHRRGPHLRLLGLGRRALFDLVGQRAHSPRTCR